MAEFPATPVPRLGSKGTTNHLVIKSEFEGNFAQTRRAATRGRKTFSLKYTSITDAEFTILEDFFNANIGGTFTWTNPQSLAVHTVRFGSDKLAFVYTPANHVNTNIDLEEV